jgi:hypothetical protein
VLKFEMEAREAGESPKPLVEREISEMGFNQPKNPITLIGLVLPGLANSRIKIAGLRHSISGCGSFADVRPTYAFFAGSHSNITTGAAQRTCTTLFDDSSLRALYTGSAWIGAGNAQTKRVKQIGICSFQNISSPQNLLNPT